MKGYFKGILKDRYILFSFVNKDLQMKYRKSFLGVAWSVITPLGLVLIIGSVYSILLGNDPKTFIPLLFTGLNPWIFLNSCADGGTFSFLSAEGYLKQTTVSPQIFPLRTTCVNMINLLYSIIAFFLVYLFLEPEFFGPKMLMVFPGLIIILIFSLGLSNISAVLNLYIRDFQPFQALIFQGLFYATPVIYDPNMLKDKGFEFVYKYNPFYYMIEIIRKPMLGNSVLEANVYSISLTIALITFAISVLLVMKIKDEIVFKL